MPSPAPGIAVTLRWEWTIGARKAPGGFAEVFEASRLSDKVSESGESKELRAVAKFVPKAPGAGRELLFAGAPKSGYVIDVLDHGEWNGYLVLIMDRADRSLREELGRHNGLLALEDAIPILLDVASGLASLDGSIVHRDIKPANILLHEGVWKLADFGISRYAEATTAQDTRKHAMTPPYAAPEQWRGDRATAATDIYAFGCVAFELLEGHPPFAGSISELRHAHLEEVPPELGTDNIAIRDLVAETLIKAPAMRPKASSVVKRLRAVKAPHSAASNRLLEANREAVREAAEHARAASVEQTAEDERNQLVEAALGVLGRTKARLRDNIVDIASMAEVRGNVSPHEGIEFRLSDSTLTMSGASIPSPSANMPFTVLAIAQVGLQIPRTYDWDGLSHSLWFCDAVTEGEYRWYETAFERNPLTGARTFITPFAHPPDDDAAYPLRRIMHTLQVAWPFTPIDQDSRDEFLDRWIEWFAKLASGDYAIPGRPGGPPNPPRGSWRS